ncbi:MAG: cytochrome c oxidase, cbb3-type, CcoQ subunit [Campylobacter sp.]|uniref:cytochrome c oxidase, cbb3-type, CcoQ subunit n=1 Tax=Campylobacter sp. TaxID=205 RepID=UPI002972B574|nr:cytochrome c oxidase, cbb3-type, CcoQ subunit [Campylobacter sp.]MDD7600609.1 cytochrome c oxidase, cbb3-type, CcoQ subunit [Campylobacteraceae bacterium]MDY5887854.1 cytochrome c oxidase, cbb3-type, CcoQ subunit [Campylobacter sp.]
MSVETIRELQGYGFFILLVLMVVILYSYWFHLVKSEKVGRRNYEKYGRLALDDKLDDSLVESSADNRSNK